MAINGSIMIKKNIDCRHIGCGILSRLPTLLQEHMVTEERDSKPAPMNAFELISFSRGLNLSGLFETRGQVRNQLILIHIVCTSLTRIKNECASPSDTVDDCIFQILMQGAIIGIWDCRVALC